MKKIIYCICFVFLWFIFSNFQCDNNVWYYGEWRINNKTTQTLIIELLPVTEVTILESCRIKPGTTKLLVRKELLFDFNFDEIIHPSSIKDTKLVIRYIKR